MKIPKLKRLLALTLALALVLALIPVALPAVEAEAAIDLSSLTCADYISNAIARSYIDTMMRYYINNYSSVSNALSNGLNAIFMFEGGSDNYWNGEHYEYSINDNRVQAVVFVVKLNSSGKAYIDFCSETCSSIASNVANCTAGVGYSGSTTILDGIYRAYRWNHTGPYAAFQLDIVNSNANGYGLYVPSSVPNGQLLGCSGINIHTRSTTAGSNWSAGCQLIGTGAYTSNEFNQFFRSVTGMNFDPWTSYYGGGLYSYDYYGYGWGSSYNVGYYIVDRQLAMIGTDGQKYGTGSLNNVFNTTALGKLTSFSTAAAQAAGALDFEYSTSQCTYYPSYCKIEATLEGAPINSQPCSVSTAYNSETLETATLGKTYTATGIFKNHYGNYWYRITTSSGETGYIYGGEVKYLSQILTDIKLTGAEPPNGHGVGGTWYVNGTVSTKYNDLSSISCYIYSGFGSDTDPVTGTSDDPAMTTNGISYVLKGSAVDDATWMGALEVGNYTYVLSATYLNYYTTSATTLASNTGTLTLMDEYFAVVQTETDQSTCSHKNTTYVLEETTCTTSGATVTVCSTCGKITESTTTGSHSYGSWVTTTQPTCTEEGVSTKTCTLCGDKQTQSIPATGHSYSNVIHPATCLEYECTEYTCDVCGDNYRVYANEVYTDWSEELPPEGIDPSMVESKTQYRYSDYETKTSYDTSLAGYTVKSSQWVQSGTKTVAYVKDWSTGFDTSNSLYSKYNKSSSKVSASTTDTAKTVINSDSRVGYIWYHWCAAGAYSTQTEQGSYTNFHAFYSTTLTPDNADNYDSSDGSYKHTDSTACSTCIWYWPIEVYEQKSTSYKMEFTYERWTDYSDWSDTAATASDTRKVETRTVYRYVVAQLGDHDWNEGVCTVCNLACEHNYENKICTICGMEKPYTDYYLIGWIDGANYGCEEDYENMGNLKFVDGQLVTSFASDSYVAVKSANNENWYFTDGWQGFDKTSITLYDTDTLELPDKFYVPGGVELTFTLTENDDGTLTLSYEITGCVHSYVPVTSAPTCTEDGATIYSCSKCGENYLEMIPATGHSYESGYCTGCGEADPDYVAPPTITVGRPSVSFEGEIRYNIYFTADNLDHVVEIGLLLFDTKVSDGTIDNAKEVITGYFADGDQYMVQTGGIAPKKMGDAVYFRIYAKLTDDTYVYTDIRGYNAIVYANYILNNSTDENMKSLVVAMLNYGAAAQQSLNYKTDSLMNAGLTAEHQNLVKPYDASMMDDIIAVDSNKVGSFVYISAGYSGRRPSVSFDGAFAINYYFTTKFQPDGEVTIYLWTQEDYANAEILTPSNASGKAAMVATGEENQYWAQVTDIVAKQIDETVFVAAVYTNGGVQYSTGVLAYSVGGYCEAMVNAEAGASSQPMTPVCSGAAVYGYYAKQYFAALGQ